MSAPVSKVVVEPDDRRNDDEQDRAEATEDDTQGSDTEPCR